MHSSVGAWQVVAIAGWAVLLLNLLLTLRVVRWLRSMQRAQQLDSERAELPELPLGEPAPDFSARDLTGRSVRSEDYRGRETALVFMSPHCAPCRREIPALLRLAALARQRAGAEILLVSDVGAGETQAWLDKISDEDQVELTVPVLLASRNTSQFHARYNPRAVTPYFCHVDRDGNVTARGGLHSPAWAAIARRWDAAAQPGRDARRMR
ncbi:MAG TPA: redoxin domain-containing protein [Jatrophihabitans sp.]|nr:redoxin domain-containing protein [Jatrophihabitans sp.]